MDMSYKRISHIFVGLILALGSLLLNTGASAQSADIDGTWRLLSRVLPDGTTQSPPGVMGLATWINGDRNLNVVWRTPDGKVASYSLMSRVDLTSNEWRETLQFSLFNDPSSGNGPVVNTPGETKTMPVDRSGGQFKVKLPFDAPAIVIQGDRLTATAEGIFIDHWERVR